MPQLINLFISGLARQSSTPDIRGNGAPRCKHRPNGKPTFCSRLAMTPPWSDYKCDTSAIGLFGRTELMWFPDQTTNRFTIAWCWLVSAVNIEWIQSTRNNHTARCSSLPFNLIENECGILVKSYFNHQPTGAKWWNCKAIIINNCDIFINTRHIPVKVWY